MQIGDITSNFPIKNEINNDNKPLKTVQNNPTKVVAVKRNKKNLRVDQFNSSKDDNKVLFPNDETSSIAEYYCGPCLDEIICMRKSLLLSEKDIDRLRNGSMIYK